MRLFLLLLILLFLSGCAKAQVATSNWAAHTETGNKIYAYQDIEPREKTTIMIVRVEGEDPEGKMAAMMKSIKEMFLGEE